MGSYILTTSSRHSFIAGAKDIVPIALGMFPAALAVGASSVASGLSVGGALALSLLLFTGVAQLVVAQLIGVNAPVWLVLVAATIISLRLVLYSLSIAPYLGFLPMRWKAVLAFFIIDPLYAVTINHFNRYPDSPVRHWYMLGAALTLWVLWQLGVAAGAIFSVQAPAQLDLDFIVTLTLTALLASSVKNQVGIKVVLTTSIFSVLLATLPFKLGLLFAIIIGTLVAWLMERS